MKRTGLNRAELTATLELPYADVVELFTEWLEQDDMHDMSKAMNRMGAHAAVILRDLGVLDVIASEDVNEDELSPPVADPETRTIRTMAERCDTCIFRPGNLMRLGEGRVQELVNTAREAEGHITCHKTLTLEYGAICRGYIDSDKQTRSLSLRMIAEGTAYEVKVDALGRPEITEEAAADASEEGDPARRS